MATASTEQLMALLEPVTVAVNQEALRVLISDRGERVGYELWLRPSPGQAGRDRGGSSSAATRTAGS